MTVHLIKLCVGVESVDQLRRHIERRETGAEGVTHTTRSRPRRAGEVLDGGSLYWVIKGVVLARQRITALEEVTGLDGIQRCRIVFEPKLVQTEPMLKRPFQGWRYLKPEDAPADLTSETSGGADLPPELRRKLMEMGAW